MPIAIRLCPNCGMTEHEVERRAQTDDPALCGGLVGDLFNDGIHSFSATLECEPGHHDRVTLLDDDGNASMDVTVWIDEATHVVHIAQGAGEIVLPMARAAHLASALGVVANFLPAGARGIDTDAEAESGAA